MVLSIIEIIKKPKVLYRGTLVLNKNIFIDSNSTYEKNITLIPTEVYTRDEYRNFGYARKIVNTIKNEILDMNEVATLNVDKKNPISNHLYASLGFKKLFSQGVYHIIKDEK